MKLETLDNGLPVEETDLTLGNKVAWLPRDKPFQVKLLEISGMLIYIVCMYVCVCMHVYYTYTTYMHTYINTYNTYNYY